jgi:hypothetical protein
MQQAFSYCANVNNPMIAEMKRMLPLAGTALDYVCVQHVDGMTIFFKHQPT